MSRAYSWLCTLSRGGSLWYAYTLKPFCITQPIQSHNALNATPATDHKPYLATSKSECGIQWWDHNFLYTLYGSAWPLPRVRGYHTSWLWEGGDGKLARISLHPQAGDAHKQGFDHKHRSQITQDCICRRMAWCAFHIKPSYELTPIILQSPHILGLISYYMLLGWTGHETRWTWVHVPTICHNHALPWSTRSCETVIELKASLLKVILHCSAIYLHVIGFMCVTVFQ